MSAPIYSNDAYKGFQKHFSQVVSKAIKKALTSGREEEIDKFTNEALKEFCVLYGGISVYIPMRKAERDSARYRLIAEEFNGKNHLELANKYGVSIQSIYSYIKKARTHKNA
ncbi:Mor transcription activator family protein [Gallibacterium genomosp. 2]|uniref:Mor transcription activator family protein n=1 Tax=Gallibacterium genomosp. 2 TaxID=155517 RepID=UPI00068FC7C3|nr:Mor transcription activator family protein [Gallibacterium genomosp. 2]